MTASEKGNGLTVREQLRALAILFLPGTWSSRFVLIGVVLLSVGPLLSQPSRFTLVALGFLLVLLAGVLWGLPVDIEYGHEPRGLKDKIKGLYGVFRRLFKVDWDEFEPSVIVISWFIVLFSIFWILALEGFVASNGKLSPHADYDSFTKTGAIGTVEELVIWAVVWLLVGVPSQARRLGLNMNDAAHKRLIGRLSATACLLSGLYLLLQHVRGPLQKVAMRSLIVGILFTIVLAAPAFSWWIRRTWRGMDFDGPKTWRTIAKNVNRALSETEQCEISPH